MSKIRKHMKATQDRQKKWTDVKRRPLEFAVWDHVFLKISLTQGVIRFGCSGKLSPRYIWPFDITERVREVTYRVAFPPAPDRVHDVFHISQLRKYVRNDQHVLDYSDLRLNHDLSYEAPLIRIIDKKEKVLKKKTMSLCWYLGIQAFLGIPPGNGKMRSGQSILIFFQVSYLTFSYLLIIIL